MSAIIHLRGSIHEDEYTLLGPLVGGSSSVFEARRSANQEDWQEESEESCVVRLLPEIEAGTATARRFESAVRLAMKLKLSGVARVVDFNTNRLPVFVATERIGGRSLEQVLAEDGMFPLPSAVRLIHQVAEILSAAHALGVIHGDLHPGAIRLTGDGRGGVGIKLLGLGWAQQVRAARRDHRHALYRAPEQRNGPPVGAVDPSVDQFALAAIAYEMLAGCTYISEESTDLADPEATRWRQPPRIAEMVLGLPAAIDEILRRALSYDASKRFLSVHEFAQALMDVTGVTNHRASPDVSHAPSPLLASPPDAFLLSGIERPTLSARTRLLFLGIGTAFVTLAVAMMASSLHRSATVGASAAPQAPAPATESVPSPPLGAEARLPPGPPQAPAPARAPVTAPAVMAAPATADLARRRRHRKRHSRLRSHHPTGHGSVGRHSSAF